MRRSEGWRSLRAPEASRQVEWSGRKCCSPIIGNHRSSRWGKNLANITRRCNDASSGRWPTARWRHLMTDRDRARSQRSRRKPGLGWYLWACDKAREHGYPHELWTTRLLARHARERGPAAGHECLANLVQGTVCKILGQEDIKPHKVRYYLENRDAEFEQKMAEVLCVYREVQVLKKAAAKP